MTSSSTPRPGSGPVETVAVTAGRRAVYLVVLVVLPVLLGAACAVVAPWSLLVLLLLGPAALLAGGVLAGARGIALVPVLGGTGLLELAFGMLLGLGLSL